MHSDKNDLMLRLERLYSMKLEQLGRANNNPLMLQILSLIHI